MPCCRVTFREAAWQCLGGSLRPRVRVKRRADVTPAAAKHARDLEKHGERVSATRPPWEDVKQNLNDSKIR